MLENSRFERLPIQSQSEILAKEGTLLAQRRFNQWIVTLYTLNNSFVELWSGEKAQVISTFKMSANPLAILEPYIDDVDVQSLIETDY